MNENRIGVAVSAPDVATVMENIARVEAAGIPAVWLTTGGAGLDGLTIFAAAAERFKSIRASWPPRIETCSTWSKKSSFAKISITV